MISRDGGPLSFFPLSFLFYILFLLFLALLAFAVQTTVLLSNHQWTVSSLFLPFPLHSDHQHSVFELHGINLDPHAHRISFSLFIADYILIYGVMVLSLWDSLFSFYRHFTTMRTLRALEVPTTSKVLRLFSIYAVIFTLLFLSTVHLYYFLFPVVVLCHFLFNLYCTWTFSAALITKYSASGTI